MATLHELLIEKSGGSEPTFNGALIACAITVASYEDQTASGAAIALAQFLASEDDMSAGSALAYLNSSAGLTALAAV